jgi:hypothetical protein
MRRLDNFCKPCSNPYFQVFYFALMASQDAPRMQRSGLNSMGSNLNSRRLARRAEYMDVVCNPGMLKVAEKSRITLRFIQATGMRSMSARGVSRKDNYWGLPFLHEQKQIHQE